MAIYLFRKDNGETFGDAVYIYDTRCISDWQWGLPNEPPIFQGSGGLLSFAASIDPAVFRRVHPVNASLRSGLSANRLTVSSMIRQPAPLAKNPTGSYHIPMSSQLPMPDLTLVEHVNNYHSNGDDGDCGPPPPPCIFVYCCLPSPRNGQYLAYLHDQKYANCWEDPAYVAAFNAESS